MNQNNPTIRAVIKRAGKPPEITTITNNLAAYQKIVGGLIDCIEMPNRPDIDFVLNDEGKLGEIIEANFYLPEYQDILCGAAVAVGNDGRGNHIGLNDEQVEAVISYIEKTRIHSLLELIIALENGPQNLPQFVGNRNDDNSNFCMG